MSSSKFGISKEFDSDVMKNVIETNKEIQQERENPEPDKKKLRKLMCKQLMQGLYLNTGYNRNQYKPY